MSVLIQVDFIFLFAEWNYKILNNIITNIVIMVIESNWGRSKYKNWKSAKA
jgi:hypothetical protein